MVFLLQRWNHVLGRNQIINQFAARNVDFLCNALESSEQYYVRFQESRHSYFGCAS